MLQPTIEYSCIREETFDVRTQNIIPQVKGKVQWHLICEVCNKTTIWELQINYYAYEQFITHCRLIHYSKRVKIQYNRYAHKDNILIKQCVHKIMVQFQKLTRNLFLKLHGQNVHRQQRQLSQFRMRYQQFAFHADCGVAGSEKSNHICFYIRLIKFYKKKLWRIKL